MLEQKASPAVPSAPSESSTFFRCVTKFFTRKPRESFPYVLNDQWHLSSGRLDAPDANATISLPSATLTGQEFHTTDPHLSRHAQKTSDKSNVRSRKFTMQTNPAGASIRFSILKNKRRSAKPFAKSVVPCRKLTAPRASVKLLFRSRFSNSTAFAKASVKRIFGSRGVEIVGTSASSTPNTDLGGIYASLPTTIVIFGSTFTDHHGRVADVENPSLDRSAIASDYFSDVFDTSEVALKVSEDIDKILISKQVSVTVPKVGDSALKNRAPSELHEDSIKTICESRAGNSRCVDCEEGRELSLADFGFSEVFVDIEADVFASSIGKPRNDYSIFETVTPMCRGKENVYEFDNLRLVATSESNPEIQRGVSFKEVTDLEFLSDSESDIFAYSLSVPENRYMNVETEISVKFHRQDVDQDITSSLSEDIGEESSLEISKSLIVQAAASTMTSVHDDCCDNYPFAIPVSWKLNQANVIDGVQDWLAGAEGCKRTNKVNTVSRVMVGDTHHHVETDLYLSGDAYIPMLHNSPATPCELRFSDMALDVMRWLAGYSRQTTTDLEFAESITVEGEQFSECDAVLPRWEPFVQQHDNGSAIYTPLPRLLARPNFLSVGVLQLFRGTSTINSGVPAV
ncbi:uncharacterized protein V1518DRAFT_426160 [Limtongia smithiae]|uniref:uncharacterized protein n=1 Tax=Limtongia smithiae TaxID=1125753 RepID=UPI0034CD43D2